MKQQSIDRRRFLSRSGNAGAGLVLAGLSSTARLRGASLNDAIEVGVIGPGGRGTSLMKLVAKTARPAQCTYYRRMRRLEPTARKGGGVSQTNLRYRAQGLQAH